MGQELSIAVALSNDRLRGKNAIYMIVELTGLGMKKPEKRLKRE